MKSIVVYVTKNKKVFGKIDIVAENVVSDITGELTTKLEAVFTDLDGELHFLSTKHCIYGSEIEAARSSINYYAEEAVRGYQQN